MDYTLIESSEALATSCANLAKLPWLAIDTEFMREKTYYPELCLVQIAGPHDIYCIDTLAVDDTLPLRALLADRNIVKVFHAARQDLEVLYYLCGMPPTPAFDTQIAAALLGYDDQLGYAALVEALTGTVLPKVHQRTNWSKRPLQGEHLEYAADDVRYLRQVYEQTLDRLDEKQRLGWALEDNARQSDIGLYEVNPDESFTRIKQGRTLGVQKQNVLRELAAWRERLAQKQNRPRNWIAHDGLLVYLAQTCPTTEQQLRQVRGLADSLREREGGALLRAIETGLRHEARRLFASMDPLTPAQTELRDRLMAHLKNRASELDVRPSVLAPRREVDAIVRGVESSILLEGWRRQVVGEELLAMLPETIGTALL